jgi:cell division protein FtsB
MQKKKEILIWSLIAGIILILIVAGIIYSRNIQLKNERQILSDKIDELREGKNQAVADMEQCRTEKEKISAELLMLNEDVAKIKSGCITENACKWHFPDIRWICNAQGDAVDNGDKICVCDSKCNLQVS